MLGGKMSEKLQNENGYFLPEAVSAGSIWQGELDENEFVQRYRPIKNHLDPNANPNLTYGMFNTYGEEYDFVKATNEDRVWSYIDGDFVTVILPGIAGGSDRLGFYITEVPWTNPLQTVLLSVQTQCDCFDQDLFDDGDDPGDPDCERCFGDGTLWVDVKKSML